MAAKVYQFAAKDGMGVNEALESALAKNFDEVVVIGIKDAAVHTNVSATVSTVVWLGMLSYLQQFLYNRMAGFE